MHPVKSILPVLLVATSICVASIALPGSAKAEGMSMQQLLNAVRQGRISENRENAARESAFRNEKSQQQTRLAQARQELAALERNAAALETSFNENELKLAELSAQLEERLGAFGEMFGIIRQVAGSTAANIQESLISAEYPEREAALQSLARSKKLPKTEAIEGLWFTLLQNMAAQSEIKSFTATIVDEAGTASEASVTRIGPFVAVNDGAFLGYIPETHQFRELGRQPSGRFLDTVRELESAVPGDIVSASIDPSRGAILGLLVQTPSLVERIDQGGLVGYFIIAIGLGGGLLGLAKIMSLSSTAHKVRRQMRNIEKPTKTNPLGRVLLSAENNASASTEVLELKLDDAILKELPALEGGLSALKLFAAIAPLLGLLGTVTGMILTFQAITLFGTGDPKLMAGGISQALVTTVLGLVVAIPLLLIHSLAAGRSKEVIHALEEQAAGVIARRSEAGLA